MIKVEQSARQTAPGGSAAIPRQPMVFIEANLNGANKCVRSMAAQVETLNRDRGKGQQKVTVEHVQINFGGQAIVGSISREDREGRTRTGDQLHGAGDLWCHEQAWRGLCGPPDSEWKVQVHGGKSLVARTWRRCKPV